tara:strand:+ start:1851 stop:2015 length:165 start_codon:yes stop_codon:yes gene_type:complete
MENTKDYYVLESTLKGNCLLKENWRKDMMEGKMEGDKMDLEKIAGLTINNFNKQ